MIFGDPRYETLVLIIATAGIVLGAVIASVRGSGMGLVAFGFQILFGVGVFVGLIASTGTVHVYDRVRNAYQAVDGVPASFAAMASLSELRTNNFASNAWLLAPSAAMKALAIFGTFRTAAAGLAGAFVFTVFRFSGNVFSTFTSGSLGIAGQGAAAAAPMATAEGQASALEAQASALGTDSRRSAASSFGDFASERRSRTTAPSVRQVMCSAKARAHAARQFLHSAGSRARANSAAWPLLFPARTFPILPPRGRSKPMLQPEPFTSSPKRMPCAR
jgi:hypothetical protein